MNMSRNFSETYTEIVESLQNKTLVITTIMVRVIPLCINHKRYEKTLISVPALQHGQADPGARLRQ